MKSWLNLLLLFLMVGVLLGVLFLRMDGELSQAGIPAIVKSDALKDRKLMNSSQYVAPVKASKYLAGEKYKFLEVSGAHNGPEQKHVARVDQFNLSNGGLNKSEVVIYGPTLEELKAYQETFNVRLGGYKEFLSALNKTHQEEVRDDDWVNHLEWRIKSAAKSMPGFSIRNIDCRSSLCSFAFEISKDRGPTFDLQKTGYFYPLAEALGKDVSLVGEKDFYTWSGFLLNLEKADMYIDTFRDQYRRLESVNKRKSER